MTRLPPLLFNAHLIYLRFGGDRLKGRVHAPDSEKEGQLAEVWDLSDHALHASVVAGGPLDGRNLQQIMADHPEALLGDVPPAADGRFPLMIRLLDVHENLVPAIHPSNSYAAREKLAEQGKYEAAYVLSAEPGSRFYATNRADLKISELPAAVARGDSFKTMRTEEVSADETFYVPAGQLHAWGPGVVIYEVHTTSNAIFALDWLDWDNKDAERRQYDLEHLQRAIVLDKTPNRAIPAIEMASPSTGDTAQPKREILCANGHFVLERITAENPFVMNESANRFVLYTLIEGHGVLEFNGEKHAMENLRTVLIPAHAHESRFTPQGPCRLLKSYVSDLDEDVVRPLLEQGTPADEIIALGGNTLSNTLAQSLSHD